MSHAPVPTTHWPLLQTNPVRQVPQLITLPQLSVEGPQTAEPQLLPVGVQVLQVPGAPFVVLQVLPTPQTPQLMVWPQPSGALPQLFAPQAWALVSGVQEQAPGPPPGLMQVAGGWQLPQLMMPPQPSTALPQVAAPQAWALLSGVQPKHPHPKAAAHWTSSFAWPAPVCWLVNWDPWMVATLVVLKSHW
jgi:hypothetical protein